MTTETLDLGCQLLCASNVAYDIQATGSCTTSATYSSGAAFVAPPVAFVAGEDRIDACLVGTTQQGVVLSFRGTLPPNIHNQQSLLDWLNDLTDVPIAAPGITGRVHDGFWQGLSALWPSILKEIQQQMATRGGSLPLYVTGHSKGGAMASLAALRLKREVGILPAAVYTFASPHPGDTDFAQHYDQEIPQHIRYEYGNDIVPHVVPDSAFIDAIAHLPELSQFCKGMESWNYSAVGKLQFIDWDQHKIVGASLELHLERLARLAGAIAAGRFEEIIGAHSSSRGGGYLGGVCPSTLCLEK